MIGVLGFQLLWSGASTFASENTSQPTLSRCQMITFTNYRYFNKNNEKVFYYFVKLVEQNWYWLHYFITLVVLFVFTVGLCRRSSASEDLDEKGWRWVHAWAKLGRRCDRAKIVRKGWRNCLHRADFSSGLKSHLQETFSFSDCKPANGLWPFIHCFSSLPPDMLEAVGHFVMPKFWGH